MTKLLLILICCVATMAQAQQVAGDKWDLKRCVDYAMKNNISVKQADVQARIYALQVQQAKLNLYPNASLNSGLGVQAGRSIDRTTNVYSTAQSIYQNFQLSSSAQLYNWHKLRNTVSANVLTAKAYEQDIYKAANDAALSVATYYLQILSANEQVNISSVQIQQTAAQIGITEKKVAAGALPELNLLELQAQLASDSSTYIAAKITYEQAVLSLKGVLNVDAALPFEVAIPTVYNIPIENIAELQPEYVFKLAMGMQPQQKANDFRILAAKKNILVSKAGLYPTLSASGSLTSNFYNAFKKIDGIVLNGYSASGSVVNVGGTSYNVESPNYSYTQSHRSFGQLWQGYGDQINNNFGQSIGVNLSIPIFSNGQYRNSYQQSKLNLQSAELQKEQADNKLKLDIYTAYTNAMSALQKFNAGKKTVESNEKVFDFAKKRYEVGLLGTLDLITNQNNLLKAKLQQAANQYDYIFKMKLLEFYKGQGLKL